MAFVGVRGAGDWADNERPENYRQQILFLWPNGDSPLTGIHSKIPSQSVDDYKFHWWTEVLPRQGGAITGVYTDAGLTSAYVSGGIVGSTLYIKAAAATIQQIRVGHIVVLRLSTLPDLDTVGKVTSRVENGDNSYVSVILREADDNGGTTYLASADTIFVMGNSNPQGGVMPEAVHYDPTEWYNYTQIWRTPVKWTRTAAKTRLRTEDAKKKEKRAGLRDHGVEREKSLIWGIRTSVTGDNGEPETTTMGLIQAIRYGSDGTNNVGTVDHFVTNSDYAGYTWLQAGEDWIDEEIKVISKYGSRNKLGVCGVGTLFAINRLIKNNGCYQLQPMTTDYGIKVVRWTTPTMELDLMVHPLFSHETTDMNSMIIYEPENVIERILDDTMYVPDMSSGVGRVDGKAEEWLTESGFEYHHPNGWAYLTGFGQDNTAT